VTVRRQRVVGAPPDAVWRVVGDPYSLPRWWPRVERVESVDDDAWTSVLRSERGTAVRADYRVEAHEPSRRRAWAQQLAGSPFERLLRAHRTSVELEPAGEGTEVTLTVEQQARGTARLGGFIVRRATARSLDQALDALVDLLSPPEAGS
jgi:uncharacterized protein YndB with AHSA1/START domain